MHATLHSPEGFGKSPSYAIYVQRLEAHGTMLAEFDPQSSPCALALVETRTGREVAPGRVGVLLQTGILGQRAQSSWSCRTA